MTDLLEKVINGVLTGNGNQVGEGTKALLDVGMDPVDIIKNGMTAGMNIVGQSFKAGDMFVPEVLMSAKAMAMGIEVVKPHIADGQMPTQGKVLIGTVKGDLHDIGKNLVVMMMESSGFEIVNLGVDISPEKFRDAVKEHKPQIVGLSALLTTTMLSMKDTIELLKEEGIRDNVKIIIGGAPVTEEFADEIGADGYAPDAASAVNLAKQLLA